MAIKVNNTEVISDSRGLNNIVSIDETTAETIGALGLGTQHGDVGTYAWLGRPTAGTFVQGTSYSGDALRYSGFLSTNTFNDDTAASIGTVAPSGTWKAMGAADRTGVRVASTLFLRIS